MSPELNEPSEPSLPERIDDYRVLRLLGRGGMGSVFEAEQDNPRRTVALKVVHAGVLGDEARRRFELEAQVLGHLHHPGIAQIYEAGVHETAGGSQPYFAMELIDGVPLDLYVEEHGLGTRERLALLARVCDGVQHAHQRGVIHRDLKPDNILVDKSGQPKILDFGLARATDSDLQAATLHTSLGQIMGTVPFMSPEQAAGDPDALDLRTDVYSLGVVAYRVLSGEMPYDTGGAQVLEALRVVREDDARPLSSIHRHLRGDVETIIGKALEKEPNRRYPSASGLAADIRRHLDDEPISARAPSALYHLKKFTRRNRALVLGVAGVFLSLLAGLVGTGIGIVRANEEAERAGGEAARATTTAAFFQSILGGVDPTLAQGSDTTLLRQILDDTSARIEVELAGLPRIEATIRETMMVAYSSISSYVSALEQARRLLVLYAESPGSDSPEALAVRRNIGHFLTRMDDYPAAEEALLETLARCEDHLGPDHVETHRVGSMLGRLYTLTARGDKAATILEGSVAFLVRELGAEDSWALDATAGLGLARIEQRRFVEAEEILREVLEVRRRQHGPTSQQAIDATHNLAGVFHAQNRFDEAEAINRETIELCERILGADHLTTLVARRSLVSVLTGAMRFEEAKALCLELLEQSRVDPGPESAFTYDLENWLANIYRTGNVNARAVPLATHAAAGFARIYGEEDRKTIQARNNLLWSLAKLNRREEAEPLFERQAEVHRRVFGEEHPDTLRFFSDYVAVEIGLKRFDGLEEVARKVLRVRRRVIGDNHMETLQAVAGMAMTLDGLERPAEAVPFYAEYIAGWPEYYPTGDRSIDNCRRWMVECLEETEDLGQFLAEIRVLRESHERFGVPSSPDTPRILAVLGEALAETGDSEEAAALLEEVLDLTVDLAAPPARVLSAYGAALTTLERYDEALDALQYAWEEDRNGPCRRRTAARLATLYEALGEPGEAAAWRERAKG